MCFSSCIMIYMAAGMSSFEYTWCLVVHRRTATFAQCMPFTEADLLKMMISLLEMQLYTPSSKCQPLTSQTTDCLLKRGIPSPLLHIKVNLSISLPTAQ